MPEMTPESEPEPSQPRTRTATRLTFLATPQVALPTVPATWVPWPLQSSEPRPSLIAEYPARARPPKLAWLTLMPVSMMYAVTPEPSLG
jgi:hypothetical protein